MIRLVQPSKFKFVDNHLASMITYCTQIYFKLSIYYDEILYFVTSLGKFDLIFRML